MCLETARHPPSPAIGSTPEQLAAYARLFPEEARRFEPLLQALRGGMDVHSRSTLTGHATASGIVVERGRLLAIHHPGLGRWIQPGGHLEAGEQPEQAALRETAEESGTWVRLHDWHTAHACPVDIDVHAIPANPARQEPQHLHFDFRYLLVRTPAPAIRAELPTRWLGQADLQEPSLVALLHKLRRLALSPR